MADVNEITVNIVEEEVISVKVVDEEAISVELTTIDLIPKKVSSEVGFLVERNKKFDL